MGEVGPDAIELEKSGATDHIHFRNLFEEIQVPWIVISNDVRYFYIVVLQKLEYWSEFHIHGRNLVRVFQPGIEQISQKNNFPQVVQFPGQAIIQFIDHHSVVLRFASDVKIREDEYQIVYRL